MQHAARPASSIFQDLPREHGFEPLRVEGRLPDSLQGTLYRCGPARFGVRGDLYPHWFDGDGAVMAVSIANGRADGAIRLVGTPWTRAENAAGKRLYRGYSQLGRGWRRWALPKNPANTSVLPWQGRLLALWEAGLPVAVDPRTLESLGVTSLDGRLRPAISAHPHRVGRELYNFGIHFGPKFALDLYAFGETVRRIASVPLPRPTAFHDFIATPRHLVFFCPPLRLRLARFLTGIGTFESNLSWEPEHGTEVVVVPLDAPQRPIRFTVPPFFQWHFVNAWEEKDDALTVDYIAYDDFASNVWYGRAPWAAPSPPPASRYARAHLDLKRKRMDVDVLSETSWEFPAIDPRNAGGRHEHTWMLDVSRGLPPTLCRFEGNTRREVPLSGFPGEAVVAGDHVLSLVYDAARNASYVAVIDAARPEDGAVARLWFDHAIPFLFHGTWHAEDSSNV
ncbi:MAG TPA: carotenoid oxygenase family protein [Thermoanaerobaculia bacterium]|nr:carotenoid oxygenase family protein [Thermoanaerobaculia bacterium]